MKKVKFLLLTALLSTSAISHAENLWVNDTNITGIQALNDGRFILYLPAGSGPVCNEGGKLFYVVPGQNGVSAEGAKTILSLALVAQSTKNKASIKYDNSTASCYVQQFYLNNVQ